MSWSETTLIAAGVDVGIAGVSVSAVLMHNCAWASGDGRGGKGSSFYVRALWETRSRAMQPPSAVNRITIYESFSTVRVLSFR